MRCPLDGWLGGASSPTRRVPGAFLGRGSGAGQRPHRKGATDRLIEDHALLAGFLTLTVACIGTIAPGPDLLWVGLLLVATVMATSACLRQQHKPASLVNGDPLRWAIPIFSWAMGPVLLLMFAEASRAQALLIMLGCGLLGGLAVWGTLRPSRVGAVVSSSAIGAYAISTIWLVERRPVPSDVTMFLTDASTAILHGHNPYRLTFSSPYSPELTTLFYGPGVVADGRITYGFPYPPAALLWGIPAHLVGDVRLAGLLALAGLAIALLIHGPGSRDRLVALLIGGPPALAWMIAMGWTEAPTAALLGFAVLAARLRRFLLAAALLGLLLASKQYFVVALPCLWLLRSFATKARVAVLGFSAVAITLPFAALDFSAFWKDIVTYQLVQPLRPDSMSLLVSSVERLGWPGHAWFGVLPLGMGIMVSCALALKAPPTLASFCAAVAISLLTTILMSKQAFVNYYFFPGIALILASLTTLSASHLQQISGQTSEETPPIATISAIEEESRADECTGVR